MARSSIICDTGGIAGSLVRIILEWDKFENCLDRLENKKQFLDGSIADTITIGAIVSVLGISSDGLPTADEYRTRLQTFKNLMKKYGAIIDRDISTIKASAMKIRAADNSK